MIVTSDIKYIGVNDFKSDLFEGHYDIPNGMAYNSYLILDEKIAVMDTTDQNFTREWIDNLVYELNGKKPTYLIIHHMEPDHSASVVDFIDKYPDATIVSNSKVFTMIDNYYGAGLVKNKLVVDNGGTLSLGKHTLTFLCAPMVHWPEVMMSYDSYDKVLFSADAFGKFGANYKEEDWLSEARRYYIGIVGKYGVQVQMILKKAMELDIKIICSLHGPVLKDNIAYYIDKYNTWSSYGVESDGILICYTSVYGHTKKAVELLAKNLEERGQKVTVLDLARLDMSNCVAEAFRYGKIVLATTTYNMEIFPYMREFISCLVERNFQNRTIGFIENGSWAPNAKKVMMERLAPCKNLTYLENSVKILSALKEDSMASLMALADELCK